MTQNACFAADEADEYTWILAKHLKDKDKACGFNKNYLWFQGKNLKQAVEYYNKRNEKLFVKCNKEGLEIENTHILKSSPLLLTRILFRQRLLCRKTYLN